jgi:hypothetical protein
METSSRCLLDLRRFPAPRPGARFMVETTTARNVDIIIMCQNPGNIAGPIP